MQAIKVLGSAAVLSLLVIAGCGGGGSDPPPAEGLFSGTTTSGRGVTGLVLDDGTYYVFYSPVGKPSEIAGVVQGNGTSAAGTFSSSNARDFNLEGAGVLSATVSASYAAKQSLNGTVSYGVGAPTSFSSTYDKAYEATPSLAALAAGTFFGEVASSAGVENATVSVTSAGAISGSSQSGCAVTGSATPRARGNVFDISLTFGGPPCVFGVQTLTGIAYFDSATKTLYAAAPNAARTDGVLFFGEIP